MKAKDFEVQIEKLNEEHSRIISVIQHTIYKKLLAPFCRRFKLRFWAGMGTYAFEKATGKHTDLNTFESCHSNTGSPNCVQIASNGWTGEKLEQWKELIEALALLPYPFCQYSIGTYMDSYPKRKG